MTPGGTALKHWGSTQPTIALSSGEAKFVALVTAVAEASELGWTFGLTVHVDSSTAKSIASRSGIGRVRHLAVRTL